MLYTKYYTVRKDADIFKYFDDSTLIYNYLKDNTSAIWDVFIHSKIPPEIGKPTIGWFIDGFNLINTNQVIIKLHITLHLISFGNYHVHAFIFCFLAFLGCVFLYNQCVNYLKLNPILCLLIFLIPSFLLWTSAPLKETLIAFLMFYALGYFIKYLYEKKNKYAVLTLTFTILTFFIKPYFAVALLPLILFALIPIKNTTLKYLSFGSIVFLFLLILDISLENFKFINWIVQKQHDFLNHATAENAGSLIYLPRSEKSFLGILSVLPVAFWNVMFRPLPFESLNPMFLLASFENVFILFLITISIIFRKKSFSKQEKELLYFLSVFCLIIILLIGVTTPVLGAIVRYKAPILPLILIICLIFLDLEKIKKYVPFKKHI
ncbi:MAG: hypothetical protein ACLGGV_01900 [Bacteroidia bacterium]